MQFKIIQRSFKKNMTFSLIKLLKIIHFLFEVDKEKNKLHFNVLGEPGLLKIVEK